MSIRILSASRRTDIPALYGPWLMSRVRAGWVAVPSPFNPRQVSRIEIDPRDTLFVFWTRWAAPFMDCVNELERLGYRFYFQHTLVGYPRAVDPGSPGLDKAVAAFRRLAERIGPERVVWRYDPILLSEATDADFHLSNFARIAAQLDGATRRVIVSLVDSYRKAASRLIRLAAEHPELAPRAYVPEQDSALLHGLGAIASERGLQIQTCAEDLDPDSIGIQPGKCIDDGLIRQVFGIDVGLRKDKGQRPACGCVESRDIGMYDSCVLGCAYCYATRSFELARDNRASRDPGSETLLGRNGAERGPSASPESQPA